MGWHLPGMEPSCEPYRLLTKFLLDQHDGAGSTAPRGQVRVMRFPGQRPGSPHSSTEGPSEIWARREAALGQNDGGPPSQDPGCLSAVPCGHPHGTPSTVQFWFVRYWRAGCLER